MEWHQRHSGGLNGRLSPGGTASISSWSLTLGQTAAPDVAQPLFSKEHRGMRSVFLTELIVTHISDGPRGCSGVWMPANACSRFNMWTDPSTTAPSPTCSHGYDLISHLSVMSCLWRHHFPLTAGVRAKALLRTRSSCSGAHRRHEPAQVGCQSCIK